MNSTPSYAEDAGGLNCGVERRVVTCRAGGLGGTFNIGSVPGTADRSRMSVLGNDELISVVLEIVYPDRLFAGSTLRMFTGLMFSDLDVLHLLRVPPALPLLVTDV